MFRRFKQRLTAWVEELQRREIARLQQETPELKENRQANSTDSRRTPPAGEESRRH